MSLPSGFLTRSEIRKSQSPFAPNATLSGTKNFCVHRCGSGSSMRACHAAGPCSIPSQDKFPRWGFFGVFPLTCKANVRKLNAPQGPRISFGYHYHPFFGSKSAFFFLHTLGFFNPNSTSLLLSVQKTFFQNSSALCLVLFIHPEFFLGTIP